MKFAGKLIIISGATATGKTSLSIDLAKLVLKQNKKVRIINFDSLLFYRELNIGTAKPLLVERQGILHEMIDIGSAKNPLNASDYVDQTEKLILECFARGEIVILVGGSAFYLRALIKGMYQSETTSDEIKTHVEKMIEAGGNSALIAYLQTHDAEALKLYHENDTYRLSRAVEHHLQTGQPISVEKKRMDELNPYDLAQNKHPDWDILHLYLEIDKPLHLELMTKRASSMLEAGLIEEVRALLAEGFSGNEKPLQSIGYKETLNFLKGEITSNEDLIEKISISTRQLAKSQKTFFRKMQPKIQINSLTDREKASEITLSFLSRP
ncbi:MAG: tRNA (adenosine(37)-N6)-dimethylallyltransferase MiaA [Bdellovibrio sp. CG_4_9_14_3_um_filter_39_7]|nr:MAG: tRNA (adenosine(37)-N6)-dimethylallyltransferase MiaA [Bdellovibrio sp. CG_4_9_14_3_um_filter_39_7]